MNNYTKNPSKSFRLKALTFALSSSLFVSATAVPQSALALDPNKDVVQCAVLLIKDIIRETSNHPGECGVGETRDFEGTLSFVGTPPPPVVPDIEDPEEEPEEEEPEEEEPEEEECELSEVTRAFPEECYEEQSD